MNRRWLVWVDDSPLSPEHPLVLTEAVGEFLIEVTSDPETKVEIRQCSADELAFAGVA